MIQAPTNYEKSSKTNLIGRLSRVIAGGLVVGAVAQGALLIMHILLGRELGPTDYGMFSFVLGVTVLLAQVIPFGWQALITRLIAQYSVERNWGLLRGAVLRSNQITVVNALFAALTIYFATHWMALEAEIATGMGFGALLLPFLAVKILRRRQLMGLHQPKLALFLDDGAAPLFMIAIVVTVGITNPGQAILIYTVIVIFICIVATIALQRGMPEQARTAKAEFQTRAWIGIALPLTLAIASRMVLNRIDILMIAPMLGFHDVGLYSAAQRISYVLLFVPMVIGTVTSSMIANAFYKNDLMEVRRIFIISMGISALAASLIMVVLIPFSDIVIRLTYSQRFTDAAVLLQILAFGQFVFASSGPIASVMMMTGQEKAFSYTITVIVVVNVVGNFIAIPILGAVGAALVTAACTTALSIWQFFLLNRRLKMFMGKIDSI